jgi:cell division protein FtsI (penicillin-binding protein 3)
VFKRIAQKIFTVSPLITEVSDIESKDVLVVNDYESYYPKVQKEFFEIPNVIGMTGMDAVSLLENIGLEVRLVGNGTVAKQSLKTGEKIEKGKLITLNLS